MSTTLLSQYDVPTDPQDQLDYYKDLAYRLCTQLEDSDRIIDKTLKICKEQERSIAKLADELEALTSNTHSTLQA